MAKVKHILRNFGSSTGNTSMSAVTTFTTHTGPTGPNDTLARAIVSVQANFTIDPTGNPPPIDWWGNSRLVLALSFNKSGGSVLPSSENDSTLVHRTLLYGSPWYPLPTNDLYGVHFHPQSDTPELVTRHKGDGVNTPKLVCGLYVHDSNGAMQNPGGFYSVVSGWSFYLTTVWESDT